MAGCCCTVVGVVVLLLSVRWTPRRYLFGDGLLGVSKASERSGPGLEKENVEVGLSSSLFACNAVSSLDVFTDRLDEAVEAVESEDEEGF